MEASPDDTRKACRKVHVYLRQLLVSWRPSTDADAAHPKYLCRPAMTTRRSDTDQ
jgi:hypothetical protein